MSARASKRLRVSGCLAPSGSARMLFAAATIAALLAAMLFRAVSADAQVLQQATAQAVALAEAKDAAPADGQPPAQAETPAPAPHEIQTVGASETEQIHVVDYGGGRWSMHAESIVAASLLRSWREAGGPDVVSKAVLDYPYTLSVHSVPAERILEGILEGWSYTLHYDAAGRLALVRVYSAEPQRMFKTPRLVESLSVWRQLETPVQPPAPGAVGVDGDEKPAAATPGAAAGQEAPQPIANGSAVGTDQPAAITGQPAAITDDPAAEAPPEN